MSLKSYPSYVKLPVDTDCIEKPTNCRFSLIATIKEATKSKSILVIMMNPSQATDSHTDNTVFNIIEHAYEYLEAQTITILNLYPFYEPNSSKVKLAISKLTQSEYVALLFDNITKIKKVINNQYDKVILGWGNAPKSFSNVEHKKLGNEILSHIKNNTDLNKKLYVYTFKNYKGLTIKNNPFHPSRKGKIVGIQKIKSVTFQKKHPKYFIILDSKYILNQKIKES